MSLKACVQVLQVASISSQKRPHHSLRRGTIALHPCAREWRCKFLENYASKTVWSCQQLREGRTENISPPTVKKVQGLYAQHPSNESVDLCLPDSQLMCSRTFHKMRNGQSQTRSLMLDYYYYLRSDDKDDIRILCASLDRYVIIKHFCSSLMARCKLARSCCGNKACRWCSFKQPKFQIVHSQTSLVCIRNRHSEDTENATSYKFQRSSRHSEDTETPTSYKI